MSDFRYPHFCPISRVAELLGERWTLLILRELFVGPQRFSDLRRGLGGLSPSVLAQRLQRLEAHGLIRQTELPPPAGATVYELDEAGRALKPAFLELTRWGMRFLEPPRPGDQIEARWLRAGLEAFARRGSTPRCAIEVRMPDADAELAFRIRGGRRGTRIDDQAGRADVVLRTGPLPLLAVLTGSLTAAAAVESGAFAVEGDPTPLDFLPELFELPALVSKP